MDTTKKNTVKAGGQTHAHPHAHDHGHPHDHGHLHGHGGKEGGGEKAEAMAWWRPALSGGLLLGGLLADALLPPGGGLFSGAVRLLWYVAAFLPVGLGVMREAAEEAWRGGDWFSEFMLMSVAAVGAFCLGEYPEAVAVMLLYCVGEALQDRAAEGVRHNVRTLLAFRPDRARRVVPPVGASGERFEDTTPEAVEVGAEIEVRVGERVPLDGRLLSADASFNTAALTGESLPRLVATGGEVLAGMIATDRTVRLRVVRRAAESAVSRILRMVEEAGERKAPTELFIRRFAHVYTPAVIALAAGVVAVPWAWSLLSAGGYAFVASEWVRRALVFLVISCPCALVISVPLGYFAGIGAASRRGILFKGGQVLDAAAELDTVVFDKTGTLTTGEFRVVSADGLSREALAQVAAMERASSHPLAGAILDHCHERGIAPASVETGQVRSEAGYGLCCGAWLVGAPRLLARHGVACPQHLAEEARTQVAVAYEGRYVGRILLSDTLRPDAPAAIAALRGLRTEILSGDRQALTAGVAAQLEVGRATGNLLPAEKVERIAALQREGRKVAFVGDGINDAPVLALSHVGFAMGGLGSDMAVETADVVIQTDQPSKVAEAIAIGRRTRRVVTQNIVMSIGVKVAVMLLGVLGVASLWMAVFADSGVALLAVLNATRVVIPNGSLGRNDGSLGRNDGSLSQNDGSLGLNDT